MEISLCGSKYNVLDVLSCGILPLMCHFAKAGVFYHKTVNLYCVYENLGCKFSVFLWQLQKSFYRKIKTTHQEQESRGTLHSIDRYCDLSYMLLFIGASRLIQPKLVTIISSCMFFIHQ